MMKFLTCTTERKWKPASWMNVFVCTLYTLCLICSTSLVYAADATLYLSPPVGTYTVNEHAMIRVFVSSDGASIYGVEGVLVFDPLKINVVSVSHEASVLTSWPTPPSFDNEKGEIHFGGVLSTSTVLDRGYIMSIIIMPLRSENFRLTFGSGAAILAGDGTGGNIVSTLKSGEYTGIPTGDYDVSLPVSLPVPATDTDTRETQPEAVGGEESKTDDGYVLGTSTQKEMIAASTSTPAFPDESTQDALELLPTPILSLDDKKFTEGEHLTGSIVSVPNSVATVFILAGGETAKEEITLDASGTSKFTTLLTLSPGTYEVWAITRDALGAISHESERVRVEVGISLMGVLKRHPLIPVVAIFAVAFLFILGFFWKKLHHSADTDDGEDNNVGDVEIPEVARPKTNNGGTIVLTRR